MESGLFKYGTVRVCDGDPKSNRRTDETGWLAWRALEFVGVILDQCLSRAEPARLGFTTVVAEASVDKQVGIYKGGLSRDRM